MSRRYLNEMFEDSMYDRFANLYEDEDYMYEEDEIDEEMDEVIEEIMDEAIEEIAESMSYMLAEQGWTKGKKNPLRRLTVAMKNDERYKDILNALVNLAQEVAGNLKGINKERAAKYIVKKFKPKKQGFAAHKASSKVVKKKRNADKSDTEKRRERVERRVKRRKNK